MSLPPAEKLPLALRKNVRDDFEGQKPELEKELSKILGTEWTIDVNPLALYPYAVAYDSWGKDSLGACIKAYITGGIYQLRSYAGKYKEEGVAELNSIASAHVLSLDVDLDDPPKYTYNSVQVRDGKLVLVTVPKYFGTNDNECAQDAKLLQALNDAPPPPGADTSLSTKARAAIRDKWDPKVDGLVQDFNKILNRSDVKLEPNFPEVFAALKEASAAGASNIDKDWEESLGKVLWDYFDGVRYQLGSAGFGKDEMLQEALNEATETGIFEFHIVDALETGAAYNEVVIKDGVFKIQTTIKNYWVNANDAAKKVVDLL